MVPRSEAEPEKRFGQLVLGFQGKRGVELGTGFGSAPGLRVGGKIFAMLVRSDLVVKLPKTRADELIAAGSGRRFDPGHGRLMKEWASVPVDSAEDWERLAREALRFVGSR